MYGFGVVEDLELSECVEGEYNVRVKLVPNDLFNEVPVAGLQGRVAEVGDGRYLYEIVYMCVCVHVNRLLDLREYRTYM